MQSTLFRIVKFQTPQVGSSRNNLLAVTSKFQLHNALRITHMMVEVMFWTLWYIRMSDCRRSLSLISWIQITYQ
jgi:hypothetical protein